MGLMDKIFGKKQPEPIRSNEDIAKSLVNTVVAHAKEWKKKYERKVYDLDYEQKILEGLKLDAEELFKADKMAELQILDNDITRLEEKLAKAALKNTSKEYYNLIADLADELKDLLDTKSERIYSKIIDLGIDELLMDFTADIQNVSETILDLLKETIGVARAVKEDFLKHENDKRKTLKVSKALDVKIGESEEERLRKKYGTNAPANKNKATETNVVADTIINSDDDEIVMPTQVH